ncbi:undecaprenyl-phosphate glucose phosphotransferase [Seongchinamella unica]|uniref:Undecaprenyl-phosphate glucose phosphotransferase n=1 Tax=Seongchinamella unica TaxID=2547392 RepID=A0A4R5LN54_9GAMM|nr:undecaprenyl-phosphate glucose phosphotransferase [Seongchinamella unica]TDG11618.1 undecaprenyl-phosphate glucose phosphotransferase [Seongchinamella unica]
MNTISAKGYLREHSNLLLWLMRTLDILLSLGSCAIAYQIVFSDGRPPPSILHYQIAIILSVLLQLVVFHAVDLYRAWRGEDQLREFTQLLLAWSIIFAILVFLSVITKTSASFSRAWMLMWFTGGYLALMFARLLLRRVLAKMRARGYNLRHVVLLADGETGQRVLENLLASPETGFNIQGYYSSMPLLNDPANVHKGSLAEGVEYVKTNRVDQIWIAMPLREEDLIEKIMAELRDVTADIRLVPDFFGFRLINHSITTIANMAVVNLSMTPMDGVNRWVKALEDRILSCIILVLISPLLLLIAIAVKLSSPGPVLYSQERLSWNGKPFKMHKFRTMPVDVESDSGPVWATQGETRATRVGSFLRKTSLDEMPQFWNVLKGDMSIVGPRPERPVFVEQFKSEVPSYMQKHKVKAGITGWAQVNGWRGNTDLQKRIEHDLYYIENWSLGLDLKIILMTLARGFINKNAY